MKEEGKKELKTGKLPLYAESHNEFIWREYVKQMKCIFLEDKEYAERSDYFLAHVLHLEMLARSVWSSF